MPDSVRNPIESLRVTWVSHAYGYGGDMMYFGEIFRRLAPRCKDMRVLVDAATPYQNPYGLHLDPALRLHRIKIARKAAGGQAYDTEIAVTGPSLLWHLLRSKADVLVTIEFTMPALLAVLAASLSPHKRLVLLVESDPEGRGGGRNKLVQLVKRWAVRRADVIQTNNERGRDYLVGKLGADPARVRVAPYLTSRPPGPGGMIEQEQGPVRLLFVNSITPRKGLGELIAALALLPPAVRDQLDFTIVGDGPERAAAERSAAALDMADRIRFIGARKYRELGPFYAGAQVLLIPSLADYRSLAGFEGLGYGLALLASRHDGATEETLVDGVNGFVIDPGNPLHLAGRIEALVNDRALLAAMQQASAALYDKAFSLDRVADNIAESIMEAAA